MIKQLPRVKEEKTSAFTFVPQHNYVHVSALTKSLAAAVGDVVVQPFSGKWQTATNDSSYYRKEKKSSETESLRVLLSTP